MELDYKEKYEKLRAGLSVGLKELRHIFPAGLGFAGDSVLHFLQQLHDDVPITSWHDEVMKMLEKAERGT